MIRIIYLLVNTKDCHSRVPSVVSNTHIVDVYLGVVAWALKVVAELEEDVAKVSLEAGREWYLDGWCTIDLSAHLAILESQFVCELIILSIKLCDIGMTSVVETSVDQAVFFPVQQHEATMLLITRSWTYLTNADRARSSDDFHLNFEPIHGSIPVP